MSDRKYEFTIDVTPTIDTGLFDEWAAQDRARWKQHIRAAKRISGYLYHFETPEEAATVEQSVLDRAVGQRVDVEDDDRVWRCTVMRKDATGVWAEFALEDGV